MILSTFPKVSSSQLLFSQWGWVLVELVELLTVCALDPA